MHISQQSKWTQSPEFNVGSYHRLQAFLEHPEEQSHQALTFNLLNFKPTEARVLNETFRAAFSDSIVHRYDHQDVTNRLVEFGVVGRELRTKIASGLIEFLGTVRQDVLNNERSGHLRAFISRQRADSPEASNWQIEDVASEKSRMVVLKKELLTETVWTPGLAARYSECDLSPLYGGITVAEPSVQLRKALRAVVGLPSFGFLNVEKQRQLIHDIVQTELSQYEKYDDTYNNGKVVALKCGVREGAIYSDRRFLPVDIAERTHSLMLKVLIELH